jgi:hypothetical protein
VVPKTLWTPSQTGSDAPIGIGYTKIRDAVNVGLGIDICRSTVANILNEAGIVPAPEREKQRTWKQFKAILKPAAYADSEGVTCVQIPPSSPNCNVFAERFVRSIKEECLRYFVFFGRRHLRFVISDYMAHYHHERFHQGIGGSLIQLPAANDNDTNGEVRCRSRLGGLLNFYYREAV